MIVTRFKYPLEDNLVNKIDLMIQRCNGNRGKKDNVLICEGSEGEGKTTMSIAIAYYVSEQTGREFSEKNVFFDVNELMRYAQSTEGKIIIWDEPAFQALSTDWASEAVKNITRLLMTARKKRHFFIFNLTKFYKFNEYIVVDRPMGFIHVYSRNNIKSGRFVYIRKKFLEDLWRDYKVSKKRNYKLYASKKVRGTFPDILNPKYPNNVLSEFDNDAYENKKDEAIAGIGKKKDSKQSEKWMKQRDELVVFIKNRLGLKFTEMEKEFKKVGINDLNMETLRRVYRSSQL